MYDEAEGKMLFAENIKHHDNIRPEDRQVTVSFENLGIDYRTEVDLYPLLEQYVIRYHLL